MPGGRLGASVGHAQADVATPRPLAARCDRVHAAHHAMCRFQHHSTHQPCCTYAVLRPCRSRRPARAAPQCPRQTQAPWCVWGWWLGNSNITLRPQRRSRFERLVERTVSTVSVAITAVSVNMRQGGAREVNIAPRRRRRRREEEKVKCKNQCHRACAAASNDAQRLWRGTHVKVVGTMEMVGMWW